MVKGVCVLFGLCISGAVATYVVGRPLPRPEASGMGAPASSTNSVTIHADAPIRALGFIEPATELRRLRFRTEGIIADCRVHVGQKVRRGDVLMSLHNDQQRAALAVAEQELAVAVAEREQLYKRVHPLEITAVEQRIKGLQQRRQFAQSQFNHIRPLFNNGTVTREQFEHAETLLAEAIASLATSQSELERLRTLVRPSDRVLAEARVTLSEKRRDAAAARLEAAHLRAPSDGVVLELLRREGEGAFAADASPVMLFADDSQLRVRAEVDERFVHGLALGQQVKISGRGLGSRHTAGSIALVKQVMGKKSVFSQEATERKDLDVIQVLIDLPARFQAPLGLRVDVEIASPAKDI